MILFWTLTALLIAAALAIVSPALLRRQQTAESDHEPQNITIARERLTELDAELAENKITAEDYENSKRELEEVLLQDLDSGNKHKTTWVTSGPHGKLGFISLLLLIPTLSVLLYQYLGSPSLITAENRTTPTPAHTNTLPTGSMDELAVKLQQRLETETPDDANGWFLLGRTYMTMKEYSQAAKAFEKAYQLVGDQPAIMVALADALTMSQQGDTTGRPEELVEKVLSMEPNNTTALWMGGLIAEKRGDYSEALRLWEKLNPLLAGSPQDQQQLAIQIARVSEKAGIAPPETQTAPKGATDKPVPSAAVIQLRVSLSEALKQQVNADDTVFVYAKAMSGPRFPLAAARYRVSDLPVEVTLDDSSAVMSSAKLSDFQLVKVGARVSASGDASARSGDLYGEITDISVDDEKRVDIVIDKIQP